ncbi:MAG: family 20 glycosylhydrolase [Spirochaetales bacterium]|nr:family 20 glycosylhydrolase [Spirochaetales bacterium]
MNTQLQTLQDLAVRMVPTPHSVRNGAADTYYGEPLPATDELAAYRVGDRLPAPLLDAGALVVDFDGDTNAEAFRIEIAEETIAVSAAGEVGRFYAVGALRQLMTIAGSGPPDGGVRLPTGTVTDRPGLGDRGFMLDVSRNRVPTRETLLDLLDLLAMVRYNHLELYFEHVFAYRDHEQVWRETGAVTAEDIRWLDGECAARGIELVPNQNSFGHLAGWMRHERYRSLAEAPDGFSDPWGNHYDHPFSLYPAEPAVPAFLAELYDELLPNFTSRRFNVGLDETFDLGQGRSAERIGELAAAERAAHPEIDADTARQRATGRVYLEMLRVVHSLVSERGRQMYFWGDIIQNHPELVSELPGDVVAVEWGYEADHDFDTHCGRLRESGVPFLVAPGTSVWNSMGGRFATARSNIRNAVDAVHRYGGRGVLMTDWGDNGDLAPATVALPALVLAGALAWNSRGAATDETASSGTGEYAEPDAFAWLRVHVFGDEGGALTEALRLLNTLDEPNGAQTIHNASILAVALLVFDLPSYQSALDDFDPAVIDAIEARAREARSLLTGDASGDGTVPASDGGAAAHYREELLFACDLALYGVGILRIRRGGAAADEGLATLIDGLDERFSQLWLSRYRPGGLEDSRRWLRKAARDLGFDSE